MIHLDNRATMREALGDAAEAIVYCYAASDRTVSWRLDTAIRSIPHHDRFTGDSRTLSQAEAESYWTLTAANELDLVGKMPGAEGILPFLAHHLALLPPLAQAAVESAQAGHP